MTAGDIVCPDMWSIDHTTLEDGYGLILQGALAIGLTPPASLAVGDWPVRVVRMDFANGVVFPGGALTDRRTVEASVETLELIPATCTAAVPLRAALAHRRR